MKLINQSRSICTGHANSTIM